jgi:hypothetical protein
MSDYEDYINKFAGALGGRADNTGEDDWKDIVYALMNQRNTYKQDDNQDQASFQKELLDPMMRAMGAQRAGQLGEYGQARAHKLAMDPTFFDDGTKDMEMQLYGMTKKR